MNLPGAGNPHKLNDRAKRRPVSEAFKGIYDHLEEIKDSAAEMGQTLHATVAVGLHQSDLHEEATHRNTSCTDVLKNTSGYTLV